MFSVHFDTLKSRIMSPVAVVVFFFRRTSILDLVNIPIHLKRRSPFRASLLNGLKTLRVPFNRSSYDFRPGSLCSIAELFSAFSLVLGVKRLQCTFEKTAGAILPVLLCYQKYILWIFVSKPRSWPVGRGYPHGALHAPLWGEEAEGADGLIPALEVTH